MLLDSYNHANDSGVLATSSRTNRQISKESWSISQGVSNALHDDECAVTAERAACLSNVTRSDSGCVPTLWCTAHKCRNNTSMRRETGVGGRTHLPAQTTARHNGTPLELAPCAYLLYKKARRFSAILSAGRCGCLSLTRCAVRRVQKHIVWHWCFAAAAHGAATMQMQECTRVTDLHLILI